MVGQLAVRVLDQAAVGLNLGSLAHRLGPFLAVRSDASLLLLERRLPEVPVVGSYFAELVVRMDLTEMVPVVVVVDLVGDLAEVVASGAVVDPAVPVVLAAAGGQVQLDPGQP